MFQTARPERIRAGNVIISERDPAVRVEVPSTAQYLGADRWVLFGIADCELHAFVEVNAERNVQRLYWVQFEQYVPNHPELHHTYNSPKHATISGMDFYVDTWVRTSDETTEPGSDLEHIMALVRNKDYRLPAAMMYLRLVHLLDEQKRKELMIIYAEDLAPTGFTASELKEGGNAHSRWPAFADALLKNAEKLIRIEPAKPGSSRIYLPEQWLTSAFVPSSP